MSAGGIDNSMKLSLTDDRQRERGHESRNRLDVRSEVYGSFASPEAASIFSWARAPLRMFTTL